MKAPMTVKQYVSQLRKIPGGRFTMGRTFKIEEKSKFYSETYKNSTPAHTVDISPFRMGATPVTVGMWREYVRANSSLSMPEPPEWGWKDSHPMVNVSWNDIMGEDGKGGYCAWAARVSGVRLLPPTEAQWEFAAKGGKDPKFPWGNEYDDSKVWSSVNKSRSGTAAVDRSNNVFVNKFGVSDLCGNVWEWCLDGYQPYIKSFDRLGYVSVSKDPIGNGQDKCTRGGFWSNGWPTYFWCALRNKASPDSRYTAFGFRLVAGPK
jgi:sulfatase modifying factor 1